MDRFISEFLAGKIQPAIKSAPIPDFQKGPVTEVVGLSYNDVVLDPDRDVLVEFYTQWCGPCKALVPEYEKLAAICRSGREIRDRVVLAMLDYDANDVSDKDVRGFSWFKLYPAGRKEVPVVYGGPYRVSEWARFIAENGIYGRGLAAHAT